MLIMSKEAEGTERIRLTFDLTDRTRRALNIAAGRFNCSVGEVVEGLCEGTIDDLREDLAVADRTIESNIQLPKPKRGRKPKS